MNDSDLLPCSVRMPCDGCTGPGIIWHGAQAFDEAIFIPLTMEEQTWLRRSAERLHENRANHR